MEFFTADEGRVGFRQIHPLIADLVRQLPALIEPDHLSNAAEGRLFPNPTDDENLEEVRSDWKAFVQPGLHEHFRTASDTVLADLRTLREQEDLFSFTLPLKHADAWLNALNQARLVLAADLGFDEKLLGSGEPADLGTDRGMAVFRINLFAFMQQCLIEQLE